MGVTDRRINQSEKPTVRPYQNKHGGLPKYEDMGKKTDKSNREDWETEPFE